MHVLVDREQMVFMYKHPCVNVLCDMAWIERRSVGVSIFPIDLCESYNHFTDLELKLLYKNTTGEEYKGHSRAELRKQVCALGECLPILEVNANEVAAQAATIDDSDPRPYRYVPGAKRPACLQELFPGTPLQAQRDSEGRFVPVPVPPHLQGVPAITPPAGASSPTRRDSPAPNTSPQAGGSRGAVREAIWAKADALWEELGRPSELKVVLAMRKQAMNELEKEGIKRSTASNELGAWQRSKGSLIG